MSNAVSTVVGAASLFADLLLGGRRYHSTHRGIPNEQSSRSPDRRPFRSGCLCPEKAPVTNTTPQARAEAKVASKPAGQVKAGAGGDINKVPEGGAIGTDKAAVAGEKRAETRDARRRNKDGSVKRKSTQGGTPN